MDRPSISALIVAKDEAEQLPGCLDSLSWVDETVVVVDAASHDATEAIARARGCVVLVREFDGFAAQRNAALDTAAGDWVLAVDADERVTPALAEEIRSRVREGSEEFAGYRVPIRSVVLGRPFRYSGTQLDRPIRLFRPACGRWRGDVHETVVLTGAVGALRAALTHQTHESMSEFLQKLNYYTDLEAGMLWRRGARPRRFDLTLRPLWVFVKLYVFRRGFMDGLEGFFFCALSAVSAAVRGWKLRELARPSDASSNPARVERVPRARPVFATPPAGGSR
jgi:glycosyltransferase involved in cell wall biosynthesis